MQKLKCNHLKTFNRPKQKIQIANGVGLVYKKKKKNGFPHLASASVSTHPTPRYCTRASRLASLPSSSCAQHPSFLHPACPGLHLQLHILAPHDRTLLTTQHPRGLAYSIPHSNGCNSFSSNSAAPLKSSSTVSF